MSPDDVEVESGVPTTSNGIDGDETAVGGSVPSNHNHSSTSEDSEEAQLTTASHYITRVGVKRKETTITIHNTPKRRRRVIENGSMPSSSSSTDVQEVYCWECHKECVSNALDCTYCSRTYHPKCLPTGFDIIPVVKESKTAVAFELGEMTESGETGISSTQPNNNDVEYNWKCPVCKQMELLRDAQNKSPVMRDLSIEMLNDLILHALQRMRHTDSQPFQHPVPASLVPDYYDVVFHPMDLNQLEKKAKRCTYTSTFAFVEETKWILHNSHIFNGATSKYTQDAKLIVKICKHEIAELELCPDCYYQSTVRPTNWFTNPCSTPHCLVWAKLKGYPFWPAKALRLSANQTNVDCRFFGEHDRAWIPIQQVFLVSEESPQATKNPKKYGLDRAIEELKEHVKKLKLKLGDAGFVYAPWRTEFTAGHLQNAGCPHYNGGLTDKQHTTTGGERLLERSWSPASNDTVLSRHSSRGAESIASSGCPPVRSTGVVKEPTSRPNSGQTTSPSDTPGNKPSSLPRVSSSVFTLDERFADQLTNEGSRLDQLNRISEALPDEQSLGILERLQSSLSDGDKEKSDSNKTDAKQESPVDQSATGQSSSQVSLAKKSNLDDLLERMHGNNTPEPLGQQPTATTVVATSNLSLPRAMKSIGVPTMKDANGPSTSKLEQKVAPKRCASDAIDGSDAFEQICDTYTDKLYAMVKSTVGEMAAKLRKVDSDRPSDNRNGGVEKVVKVPDEAAQLKVTALEAQLQTLRQEFVRLRKLPESAANEMRKINAVATTEIRHSLEKDAKRQLSLMQIKSEQDKAVAVNHAKTKQWCANCYREAVFYCCWNTSYCDYPCQQRHWNKHQAVCAQIRQPPASAVTASPPSSGLLPTANSNAGNSRPIAALSAMAQHQQTRPHSSSPATSSSGGVAAPLHPQFPPGVFSAMPPTPGTRMLGPGAGVPNVNPFQAAVNQHAGANRHSQQQPQPSRSQLAQHLLSGRRYPTPPPAGTQPRTMNTM